MRKPFSTITCGFTILMLAVTLVGCGGSGADRHAAPDPSQQTEPAAGDSRTEGTTSNRGVEPVGPTATAPNAEPNEDAMRTMGSPVKRTTKKSARSHRLGAVPKGAVSKSVPKPTAVRPESEPGDTDAIVRDLVTAMKEKQQKSSRSSEEATSQSPSLALQPGAGGGVVRHMARDDGEAAEEMPASAAPTDTTEMPKDYTEVEVFYGTDREAIVDTPLHSLGKIPWNYLTYAAGAITLLLLIILCFARRSTIVRAALLVGILATIGLGVCMIKIPRNTKPEEADTSLAYGNERNRNDTFEMGVCKVSIPKGHEVGELESPSIFHLEVNEDPEKHVVLLGVEREEPAEFFKQLNQRIDKSERKEAFVFIHGYNVTFENAARRTAQLAYDLNFDGAPIFYSWPSQGGLLQYTVDETNVVWAVPHLKQFLLDVAQKTKAKRIHLIAHSMGNRALTSALVNLSMERGNNQQPLFHEVLLTAPDIDADVFKRDIVPAIVKTANRVTLYASSHDAALAASKKVHGYPRAGESGDNIIVLSGIDTIDVSAVDTSLMGHSYYGDSDTVLVDMAELLRDERPPTLRERLLTRTLGPLQYWVFLAKQLAHPQGTTAP